MLRKETFMANKKFKPKNIPYNKPIPSEYARELRSVVKLGTPEDSKAALEEMLARNKALVKRANNALSRLEKAGFKRYAYDRAVSYTESEFGMSRFTASKSKLTDVVDLQFNLQELSNFLSSKSSTVSGNKMIDRKIVDAFRDYGMDIPKGSEKAFIDLIKSDEFETLKTSYVDSRVLISDMVDLIDNYGVSIEKLSAAFEKLVNSEDETYDVMLEELGKKI